MNDERQNHDAATLAWAAFSKRYPDIAAQKQWGPDVNLETGFPPVYRDYEREHEGLETMERVITTLALTNPHRAEWLIKTHARYVEDLNAGLEGQRIQPRPAA